MERVERISDHPHQHQRTDDERDLERAESALARQLAADRDQDHQTDDEGDAKQDRAVGIVGLGILAHLLGRVVEQADRRDEEAERGDVEADHHAALPAEHGHADRPADDEQPDEQQEARRRDTVADGFGDGHGAAR